MTRGYKNCNPLNIERSKTTAWRGEIIPSQDVRFAQFESMDWGYRAAFKLLNNYQRLHGCRILRDFIERWAPPSENNTQAYIHTVCERSGIAGLSDVSSVDTTNAEQMIGIVSAMSYMENGVKADPNDVRAGWDLFAKELYKLK